jgi:flagellar hook-basal body complex protein FliE
MTFVTNAGHSGEAQMNSIRSVDSVLAQVQRASQSSTQRATGADFGNAIAKALGSVSNQQVQAQNLQQRFQLEDPNVSLEDTMIAMQKGQIGFQAAVQVRNKLVQAYSDIMNMQV